jgi:hypothetical protein
MQIDGSFMLEHEIIIRRLATIKYLYNIGVQQSSQVETVAGFSILAFHDCAEMFLLLVAENKGDNADNISFMGFWDKYPDLTLKESMRKLKDRRVSIKHKGLFPSKSDIEISRITMTDFLEQNTIKQFGVDFKDVSVASLISYDNVKQHLDKAEVNYNEGNLYECLVCCKISFLELLSTYESNKFGRCWGRGVIDVGKEIGGDYRTLIGTGPKTGEKWFRQVTETTNKIREILKITALGIDYKKFSYFDVVTPRTVRGFSNGKLDYITVSKEFHEQRFNIRASDCQFCMDFVIDCALKLQGFDYDISSILKQT